MSLTHLSAGFMPLLDSLLLVLAHEKEFAREEGLELHLVKESSWANIRDRAALGHFDAAQMLAPMPIAASLGLTPLAVPMIAPVVLGLGNNGITVSAALWERMVEMGAAPDLDPARNGMALEKLVRASEKKLRFGVVHQTSSHNYELRYWLAASGIRPDSDVDIVVLPPQYLPDALQGGGVDGYCVGEPWNSVGVAQKGGHIVTLKEKIWRASPDKVIALRARWAQENPEIVAALVRAIYKAGLWASVAGNLNEMAQIMARPAYLAVPAEIVKRGLSGQFALGGGAEMAVPTSFRPSSENANYPWQSHALWYYSQMVRWGEAIHSPGNAGIAASCFAPDIYRDALAPLGADVPIEQSRVETGFFDGTAFDPDTLEDYLRRQAR